MKMELFNPYVLKILISAREEDSVSSISKRIGLSYGWTYKWANELIKEGIFKEKWRGIILQKNNENYKRIMKFIKNIKNVNFYYSVLDLFGIKYCFTKTDAVYIYTEGRYNISRYKGYYPIFIKIKREDYNLFLEYCKRLDLKINAKRGIFYVPEISVRFKVTRIKSTCVEPLDETINFMKKNIFNFEPALEMIQEIYHKDFGIKYKEVNNF
ncbi:hypothetical protein J4217_00385 [Candidatus Pacearchaeota archaeon]|nr:hypothetical protein [Candidatus Pacearchaeota archaeon]